MSDLVQRLRQMARDLAGDRPVIARLCDEAADAIEAQDEALEEAKIHHAQAFSVGWEKGEQAASAEAEIAAVRRDGWTALVQRMAEVAEAIAFGAGVGGMELAGQIVSVLAKHPGLIGRFVAEGSELFLTGELGAERGCLSFFNMKGEVTTPEELQVSIRVRDIKRAALRPTPTPPAPEEG